MNADGSNQGPLTNHRGGSWPTWSPDGTRIALTSLGVNRDIFVVQRRREAGRTKPDQHSHGPGDLTGLEPASAARMRRATRRPVGPSKRRARGFAHASCTVGRVRYIRPASRRGRVVGQSLRPGTRRSRGTQVNLVVRRTLVTATAPALSKDTLSFVAGAASSSHGATAPGSRWYSRNREQVLFRPGMVAQRGSTRHPH